MVGPFRAFCFWFDLCSLVDMTAVYWLTCQDYVDNTRSIRWDL